MSEFLVEVQGLDKSFPTADGEIHVLRKAELTVKAGEKLAILGESGVGKSTLLHILGTLDRPTSGSLRLLGEEVAGRTSRELAELRNRVLGFVFQFHHLLPEFDALENTMMPGLLRGLGFDEMRERGAAILRDVGLEHRIHHRTGKLSGGERQRVAVARALVLEPPLLLADEPTGNLDPATGARIEDLLLEMNRTRGTALVVVTHNERLAGKLGRAAVLSDGRLGPIGPAAAVAAQVRESALKSA